MMQSQISNVAITSIGCILLMCFASCLNTQSADVVSFKQINSDEACGPRCLWALMQITSEGRPDYNIEHIYSLIGKQPYTVTNLKDLKDAAQQLGFLATGYKLAVSDLEKVTDYAILPVGGATGTPNDSLHFILARKVAKDYAMIINTRTLKPQTIPVFELEQSWKGYALVIAAGNGMKPLRKVP